MARRLGPARGFKNDLRKLKDDVLKQAANGLREAARGVLQDLYDESPAWSGIFRTRWYSQLEGRGNRVYIAQGVPRIKPAELRRGPTAITIGNASPYATIAMDLQPGTFVRPSSDPIKEPVVVGRRVGRLRGQVVGGEGGATSTADLDWYTSYMEGGRFAAAFKKGSAAGFLQFKVVK